MSDIERCSSCIYFVRDSDGLNKCVRNGFIVGDSDLCSGYWSGDDFIDFVREVGSYDKVEF